MEKIVKPNNKTVQLITIITKDSKEMKIDKRIAFKANTIKAILEDKADPTAEEEAVPVLFDENVLIKVFEFI